MNLNITRKQLQRYFMLNLTLNVVNIEF